MSTFKHKLGDDVRLAKSSEAGTVVGRAEYTNASNAYFVRYLSSDQRQVEAWWSEDAILVV